MLHRLLGLTGCYFTRRRKRKWSFFFVLFFYFAFFICLPVLLSKFFSHTSSLNLFSLNKSTFLFRLYIFSLFFFIITFFVRPHIFFSSFSSLFSILLLISPPFLNCLFIFLLLHLFIIFLILRFNIFLCLVFTSYFPFFVSTSFFFFFFFFFFVLTLFFFLSRSYIFFPSSGFISIFRTYSSVYLFHSSLSFYQFS